MPRISAFYGIVIRMFYNGHSPPHFHAEYGEYEAVSGIATLEVMRGHLPRRAHALVVEWTTLHRLNSRRTGIERGQVYHLKTLSHWIDNGGVFV